MHVNETSLRPFSDSKHRNNNRAVGVDSLRRMVRGVVCDSPCTAALPLPPSRRCARATTLDCCAAAVAAAVEIGSNCSGRIQPDEQRRRRVAVGGMRVQTAGCGVRRGACMRVHPASAVAGPAAAADRETSGAEKWQRTGRRSAVHCNAAATPGLHSLCGCALHILLLQIRPLDSTRSVH